MIELLRDKVYFIKNSFNASNFPLAAVYYNNASKIIAIYGEFFLLPTNQRLVCLAPNASNKVMTNAGHCE